MFAAFRACLIVLIFVCRGNSLIAAEPQRLLGKAVVPNNLQFGGTTVGGLSGISYDAGTKTFWAISDDSSNRGGPPRAYQIRLSYKPNGVLAADFLRVLPLRDADGKPLGVADAEGIACTGKGAFWASSEGRAGKKNALPWLRMFSQTNGRTLREIPAPAIYLPADRNGMRVKIGDARQASGVVSNRSLESCTLSPDRRTLYTASETSLLQERAPGEGGGGASILNSTQVRISALDAKSGKCRLQKLYRAENGCLFGSVSDLFCLEVQDHLLVLERRVVSLTEGPGSCQILVYEVDLAEANATDLRNAPDVNSCNSRALTKKLVFDSNLADAGKIDNIEGLCIAPGPGGERVLVAVSDNNFNSKQQTQILVFRCR